MNALGRHILVEFTGCNADVLNDVSAIEKSMIDAAKIAGATVISSNFHHFSPWGVSGVVVIQESHLAIHTWPEYRYASVDLFTCGETVDPWVSFEHLKQALEATYSAIELNRGALNIIKKSDYKPTNVRIDPSNQIDTKNFKIARNVWFTDKDDMQALSLRYTGDVLFNETTDFQQVRVFDTLAYGKMLAINNMVMCTERDEFHYHEMIVHPVAQLSKNLKNVLVIGGGDGGTIRELFKYSSIEKVTMVEIDEAVINASKKHLPTLNTEFGNPKLNLIVGDGIEHVRNAKAGTYDLVIVDGSDPVGPAEGLFTKAFYADCARVLTDDGMLVTQGESPMFHTNTFVELNHCLKDIFGMQKVHTMLFHATTYPSGMWSLMMASKKALNPKTEIDIKKTAEFVKQKNLKYYNEELHAAAFCLPNFVKNLLEK
ncbi:MAG: polyamine aminopropyltransferase [Bdellovibrionaceae bacterium]|nr:polyamine aminopropyltransferase [Pseudobdellovibrionaceae bacterium]